MQVSDVMLRCCSGSAVHLRSTGQEPGAASRRRQRSAAPCAAAALHHQHLGRRPRRRQVRQQVQRSTVAGQWLRVRSSFSCFCGAVRAGATAALHPACAMRHSRVKVSDNRCCASSRPASCLQMRRVLLMWLCAHCAHHHERASMQQGAVCAIEYASRVSGQCEDHQKLTQRALPAGRLGDRGRAGTLRLQEGEEGGRGARRRPPCSSRRRRRQQVRQAALQQRLARRHHFRRQPAFTMMASVKVALHA